MSLQSPAAAWTDRIAWDRFVDASPQGSVFLRSEFLDALDVSWDVVRTGEGPTPDAAAVVLRDEVGIVRGPIPFTQYQGVVLPAALADAPAHRRVGAVVDRLSSLLAAMEPEGRLTWCLHPSLTDVRAFSWFNYGTPERGQCRVEIRYSGRIALDRRAGMEGVLAACRSVRRQEYRKATARFQIAPVVDLDLLDRLHETTFARQGLHRSPREVRLLRSIAGAALKHGFGELLAAFDQDGRPAGAVLFLFDQKAGYYLVAANDPDFRSAGVSTLLFLTGVERSLARAVEFVDVVGMNSPARGEFKASFGAEPLPYHVVTWERP